MKSCATCKHSSHSSDALECAHRPGYTTYEGGLCEDHTETNWQRYFGTPDLAARTLCVFILGAACPGYTWCAKCPASPFCKAKRPGIVEWLEADAE